MNNLVMCIMLQASSRFVTNIKAQIWGQMEESLSPVSVHHNKLDHDSAFIKIVIMFSVAV